LGQSFQNNRQLTLSCVALVGGLENLIGGTLNHGMKILGQDTTLKGLLRKFYILNIFV
jgi:hypothetical protein